MDQEKIVMLIAVLLFINLIVSGWTLTRSMMRPLEKREAYAGFADPSRFTMPTFSTTGTTKAK